MMYDSIGFSMPFKFLLHLELSEKEAEILKTVQNSSK